MPTPQSEIQVTGARLHNLRDVSVAFPRNQLIAFTGISGSGKSSLAFGTIHGEAQRRYFDSVAPFARRLIHTALDPQVRDVQGLPPTVALEQSRSGGSTRSTVGTITATSNSLRLLYSRCGDYPQGVDLLYSDSFSPNTADGACPECSGLGVVHRPTEASLVPDPSLSIADGAITAWPGAWQGKNYRDVVDTLGYDIHIPWRDLPQEDRDFILFSDTEPAVTVHPVREAGRVHRPYQGKFASAARYVMRTLAESKSASGRAKALDHVETTPCQVCDGRRLNPAALAVTWQGLPIDEANALPVDELLPLLRNRLDALGDDPDSATARAERLLADELASHLQVVVDLGIGHLDLGRSSTSISSGELQRLRVASSVRSGLFGVVYVLDEPSAGLHPRDTESLLAAMRGLVEAGNTVLIVEHDMALVQACDWVVDVGPGAGVNGGEVLYSGPTSGLGSVDCSVTARYVNAPVHPADIRAGGLRQRKGEALISGVTAHTVQDVSVSIPLGLVTVITGISGSGKSTLLTGIGERIEAATFTGDGQTQRTVSITQRPIGRTPRSNLATYTGLFDHVRKLFTKTPLAKERAYNVGRFSFNVASGRCPTCQGEGSVAIELLFLPGTYSTCPDCKGSRYNNETLEVRWNDRNIADVLALTVDDAIPVFSDEPPVARALAALQTLGLGYLRLGQPATELSGGEAQRIKLATELQTERRAPTLYLLDEPTSGLHPADVHRLLAQLHRLADAGHTVVMVEHDEAALSTADWQIEMGPGAGRRGGQIVRSSCHRPPTFQYS
ncbi:excinuclease ABC subunit UvrA [Ornithinimicrobium sp. Arc0846-15]|nr:excinuclease ABC subunit UvrA [Ornithinimicrobium laminariae]